MACKEFAVLPQSSTHVLLVFRNKYPLVFFIPLTLVGYEMIIANLSYPTCASGIIVLKVSPAVKLNLAIQTMRPNSVCNSIGSYGPFFISDGRFIVLFYRCTLISPKKPNFRVKILLNFAHT